MHEGASPPGGQLASDYRSHKYSMIENEKSQEKGRFTVLRVYREALDLSQDELAKEIGVHRRTIIRCEKGERDTMFTTPQFQRFCRLVYSRLGLGALLHFAIGTAREINSFESEEVKLILEQEKKSKKP